MMKIWGAGDTDAERGRPGGELALARFAWSHSQPRTSRRLLFVSYHPIYANTYCWTFMPIYIDFLFDLWSLIHHPRVIHVAAYPHFCFLLVTCLLFIVADFCCCFLLFPLILFVFSSPRCIVGPLNLSLIWFDFFTQVADFLPRWLQQIFCLGLSIQWRHPHPLQGLS